VEKIKLQMHLALFGHMHLQRILGSKKMISHSMVSGDLLQLPMTQMDLYYLEKTNRMSVILFCINTIQLQILGQIYPLFHQEEDHME